MAQLKELRTRIEAIKSTQKITSAMKMIAAARLRKVQILVDKNVAYAGNLRRSALRVLTEIEQEEISKNIVYPRPIYLRQVKNPKNYVLYVFSSDRGLCGSYNTTIAKKAIARINQLLKAGKKIKVICYGKKALKTLRHTFAGTTADLKITAASYDVKEISYAELAGKISHTLLQQFENKEFDVCEFVYANFITALTRIFECEQVFPINLNTDNLSAEELEQLRFAGSASYEYLPDKMTVLTDILPILFTDTIFQIIVNAEASEHSARMSSMDNATRNAKKMISELTLKYNSLRQAAITTELIEIIAGAEAI